MNNSDWKKFLALSRRILGPGASVSWASDSWCAWTTFTSLKSHIHYWKRGLPDEADLLDTHTIDGGVWGQAFDYEQLAHVIIPATFYWEKVSDGDFHCGHKTQDLAQLSHTLNEAGIAHRLTELVLEIKLY